jgi:hypothetical protein
LAKHLLNFFVKDVSLRCGFAEYASDQLSIEAENRRGSPPAVNDSTEGGSQIIAASVGSIDRR